MEKTKVITYKFDGYNLCSLSDENSFRNNKRNPISLININFGQNKIPFGTILKTLSFQSNGDSYETEAQLGNMVEKSELYKESIVSKSLDCNSLFICSPYSEYLSVANEMSIFFLLRKDILTLHASCCIKGSNCVVFLGRSNSGKTTSAKMVAEQYAADMIADDHIHIMLKNSKTLVSAPIWDVTNKTRQICSWFSISNLDIVCLDAVKMRSILDLRRFSVGYAYHSQINDKVYQFINDLYKRTLGRTMVLNEDFNSVPSIMSRLSLSFVEK